nr:MAG TPA: portal protein [Caudoviricetes sp.]
MAQKKTKLNTIPPANDVMAREEFAAAFAKAMAQQVIHDPDGKTSRRTSRTYTSYTRENIEGYLEAPTSNEKELRNASIFLYQTHSRYRNLLHYYACVPRWYYTITPLAFNPEKVKKETFRKQYQKVCNIIESMGVIRSMREAVLVALREGAYYGVIWGGDGNSFILQKLNPDYCQIVSITDGNVFQFAYDMSKIKESDLETYYPPQFTDMYRIYQAGGSQYQVVPPEIGFCIKGDSSIPEYSIPPFAAVLPSLYSIKNVEDLTETATELSNYKLIAGVLPVDDEGVPLIDYPTAMQYYSHIAGNVGDRVGVAISPFELKSYDFEQSGTIAQIDNVARANENFFASAGTSALLHGATNSTSGVTKLAIKTDEAFAFTIMNQCGAAINRFLKTLSGNIKFKVNFLPVSIFNESEMVDQYKSAMNYGMGKLQYAACIGIAQSDLLGQAYIENEILDFNTAFTPMQTAATRSAKDQSPGRPESDDISDEGEETRDTTTNDNK